MVNRVICCKFSKNLIKIKEKDKKSVASAPLTKKENNKYNKYNKYNGIRTPIAPREDAKPRRF